MTKQTTTANVSSFTTDAKFRSWGLAASTALQACGLVFVTDTGQINWSTVLKATATNTKQGYEIYRFDDTLQGTKPVFIRFDYGSGGVASGNSPSTWITIGTGWTDGGNITGLSIASTQSGYTSTSAMLNTAMAMEFTHVTAYGYLLANFGKGSTSASGTSGMGPGFYVVERTKDASDNPTGSGLGVTYPQAAGTVSLSCKMLNFDTSIAYATARLPYCGALSTAITLTSGADVALYRHYIGAGTPYAASGMLTYFSGDIADSATFTSSPLGDVHTYAAWTNLTTADSSGSSSLLLAYMWED